jgi:hypothetical protein
MSFGDLTFVEMAVNRVADLRMQICQVIGLGEDRFPQGPSREASLGASSTIKITSGKLRPAADALIVRLG